MEKKKDFGCPTSLTKIKNRECAHFDTNSQMHFYFKRGEVVTVATKYKDSKKTIGCFRVKEAYSLLDNDADRTKSIIAQGFVGEPASKGSQSVNDSVKVAFRDEMTLSVYDTAQDLNRQQSTFDFDTSCLGVKIEADIEGCKIGYITEILI